MTVMKLKKLIVLLFVGAAVIVAGVVMVLRYESGEALETVRLEVVEDCALDRQRCEVVLPDGQRLQFEMTPKPLSTSAPLTLTARLSNPEIDRVEVLFEGKDMYMGFLQYRLKPDGDGLLYQGQGSLSICTRKNMEWFAVVRILQQGRWTEVPIPFETYQH